MASDFDASVRQSRESYAALVGVDPSGVAIGSQVSVFVGLVASTLPDRTSGCSLSPASSRVSFSLPGPGRPRGIRVREVGPELLHRHALGLANRFRELVGVPAGQSAIVSLVAGEDAGERLRQAGVVGSVRAGRLRLSFHLNNTEAEVISAAEALAGDLRE